MIVQFEAAWATHLACGEAGCPYAIIGGVALQYWGEPRFTQDLDLTVLVEPGDERRLAEFLVEKFAPRISDAVEFSLQTRVLLLRVSGACDVDISFGLPGYESELMNRRIDYQIGDGRLVKLCSAEDLVILKMLASRPRDLEDVEGILLRQGPKMDRRYIRMWLREFSEVLENCQLVESFERLNSA